MAYIITTRAFEQFLVPSYRAAEETFEARDGLRIDEVPSPEGLDGCYMYRGAENRPWADWIYQYSLNAPGRIRKLLPKGRAAR